MCFSGIDRNLTKCKKIKCAFWFARVGSPSLPEALSKRVYRRPPPSVLRLATKGGTGTPRTRVCLVRRLLQKYKHRRTFFAVLLYLIDEALIEATLVVGLRSNDSLVSPRGENHDHDVLVCADAGPAGRCGSGMFGHHARGGRGG